MTIGNVYTLKEAAKLTGVSHSTIRRRHTEGAFPNSYKDGDGIWKVPLTDLEQAGIRPRRSSVTERAATVTLNRGQTDVQSPTPPLTAPIDRVNELVKRERDLMLEVDKYREQAHQAERDVSELKGYVRGMEGRLEESKNNNRELSARNADLTKALIAIEAKVTPVADQGFVVGETVPLSTEPAPSTPQPEPRVAAPPPKPAKKRWWNR